MSTQTDKTCDMIVYIIPPNLYSKKNKKKQKAHTYYWYYYWYESKMCKQWEDFEVLKGIRGETHTPRTSEWAMINFITAEAQRTGPAVLSH